ncbi:MAG: four helix bundle protein, partial [Pyrinomonadaceae bacterium]
MKSFRELRVWQKAIDLVEKIYLITQKFPREETY